MSYYPISHLSLQVWEHLDSDTGEAGPVARVEARGVRLVGLGALPLAVVHLNEAVPGADAEHGEEDEEGDAVDVGRLAALKQVNMVLRQLEIGCHFAYLLTRTHFARINLRRLKVARLAPAARGGVTQPRN